MSNHRLAATLVGVAGLLLTILLTQEGQIAVFIVAAPAIILTIGAFVLVKRWSVSSKSRGGAVFQKGLRAMILLVGGSAVAVLVLLNVLHWVEGQGEQTSSFAETSAGTSERFDECQAQTKRGFEVCLGMSDNEMVWESCRRSYLREMASCTR